MNIQSFRAVEPSLFARITQPLRALYLDLPSGACIEFFDAEIEKRQKEIVRERGFELVDHNLVLYVRQAKK